MSNLANINVTITATDNTGSGVSSAMSNLSRLGGGIGSIGSIASGVFGGILGFSTFRAIASGIGSVVSSALTLNSRMAQSSMAAKSMVDAIANAEPTGTDAFGKLSKAAEQYEKTMREIREREADGLDDYADKVDDIKAKILAAENEIAEKKTEIYNKEKRQIEDLNESHLESVADINTRIANESADFNEQLYDMANSRQDKLDNLEESHSNKVENINKKLVDAEEELLVATTIFAQQKAQAKIDSLTEELNDENTAYNAEITKINERADHEVAVTTEKHNKQLAALQLQLTRENAEYDKKKARIEQDAKDDIAQAVKTSDEKVKTLKKQLTEEEEEHKRFLRDIKEAYADAATKMDESISGGGGGGGTLKRINFAFDFNQNLKKMTQDEIDKFLSDVQDKYIKVGIKSPFNIADIQEFGKTMIRYTDGSVSNMEKILTIGQSLAAFNPVQGIQGATFALNELLGAGNQRSLVTRFNLPPGLFEGLEKAKDSAEALDILTEGLNNVGVNIQLVDAYANAMVGAQQNVLETFNVLGAALLKPIYDQLTGALVSVNKFLAEHYDQIKGLTTVIANFTDGAAKFLVDSFVQLGTTLKTFWSEHGKQVTDWFNTLVTTVIGFVVPMLNTLQTTWTLVQKVLEEVVIPGMKRIFDKLSELWIVIAPLLKKSLEEIAKWWKDHSDQVLGIVKIIWSVIEFVVKTALDVITGIIKIQTAIFKGDWQGAWEAIESTTSRIFENIKQLAKGLWEGISTFFKSGINGIIDNINGFINSLNSLNGKKVGPVTLDFKVPQIPKLATGGIVTSPTIAMIGEAGAEAVVPLGGGRQGSGIGGPNIYVEVTGNTILDDQTAEILAEKVGKTLVNTLALRGKYL